MRRRTRSAAARVGHSGDSHVPVTADHEHRTFATAVLLSINPFDQFGVELGKEIANSIAGGDTPEFDRRPRR